MLPNILQEFTTRLCYHNLDTRKFQLMAFISNFRSEIIAHLKRGFYPEREFEDVAPVEDKMDLRNPKENAPETSKEVDKIFKFLHDIDPAQVKAVDLAH